VACLDRPGDRLEGRALGAEQLGRALAGPVEHGQLEQELGAELADVIHRGVQPEAGGLAAARRGGVDGALRALAGFRALGSDELRVEQAADGPVDDRLRYLPDPAKLTAVRGELRDRETVGGPLAEDREDQPFRQRHLGKRCRCRGNRWLGAHEK